MGALCSRAISFLSLGLNTTFLPVFYLQQRPNRSCTLLIRPHKWPNPSKTRPMLLNAHRSNEHHIDVHTHSTVSLLSVLPDCSGQSNATVWIVQLTHLPRFNTCQLNTPASPPYPFPPPPHTPIHTLQDRSITDLWSLSLLQEACILMDVLLLLLASDDEKPPDCFVECITLVTVSASQGKSAVSAVHCLHTLSAHKPVALEHCGRWQ